MLPSELPEVDCPVVFDFEASGLYVDGYLAGKVAQKLAPPARASSLAVAWFDELGQEHYHAWPFDQGFIPGKPGRVKDGRIWPLVPPRWMGDWPDTSYNLPPDEYESLLEWLGRRWLIAANAKYDCLIADAGHRLHPEIRRVLIDRVIWDTMLAQGVMEPLESTALKITSHRLGLFGGHERDAEQQLIEKMRRQGPGLTKRYDLPGWEDIREYVSLDSRLALRLHAHQTNCLDEGGFGGWGAAGRVIQDVDLPMMRLLFRMEQRGVGFNADKALRDAEVLEAEINQLAADLPFDRNINKAKEWYFTSKGLDLTPTKFTEKGAPSLDESELRDMAERGIPHAAVYLKVRQYESAVSKWYRGWPLLTGPDGRIRTSFRQCKMESDRPGGTTGGAISGRLSVERWQSQAVPRHADLPPQVEPITGCIEPKLGHEYWEFDMSQAEVRIATWAARCHPMAEILRSGRDVHGEVAKRVFGIDESHPRWDEYRQVAKRLTFAMLYGAGVDTTREQIWLFAGVDYSRDKTKDLIADYRSAFPEFPRTAATAQDRVDRTRGGPGFVTLNVSGRRRWFGWGERTHKAFNAVIQGNQAEALKLWMLAIEARYPGMLVMTVHDSVWLEIPVARVAEVVPAVCKLGSDILEAQFSRPELLIPFPIDAKKRAA